MPVSPVQHVVFIVLDSLRADTAMCGNAFSPSHYAVEFTQARAAGCWTLPAHAAMFTGAFPHETGTDRHSRKLGGGYHTLAEIFRAEGWHTHQCTANGVTTDKPNWGLDRGFESIYKTYNHMPKLGLVEMGLLALSVPRIHKLVAGGNAIMLESETQASKPWFRDTCDDLMDEVHRLRQRHRVTGKKSFIYVNMMEMHFPYHVSEKTTLQNLLFGKGTISVSFTDKLREIQALYKLVSEDWLKHDHMTIPQNMLQVLKRRQQAAWERVQRKISTFVDELCRHNDTMVIVCSDHGDAFGEHGDAYHVQTVSDGCNRVPLWIFAPNVYRPDVHVPVSTKDLFGTILQHAGVHNTGVNLLSNPERSEVILQSHPKADSIASRRYSQFVFIERGMRYLWRPGAWQQGLWYQSPIAMADAPEPAWEALPGTNMIEEALVPGTYNRKARLRFLRDHFERFKAFAPYSTP